MRHPIGLAAGMLGQRRRLPQISSSLARVVHPRRRRQGTAVRRRDSAVVVQINVEQGFRVALHNKSLQASHSAGEDSVTRTNFWVQDPPLFTRRELKMAYVMPDRQRDQFAIRDCPCVRPALIGPAAPAVAPPKYPCPLCSQVNLSYGHLCDSLRKRENQGSLRTNIRIVRNFCHRAPQKPLSK